MPDRHNLRPAMPLSAWLDWWIEHRVRPRSSLSTVQNYRNAAEHFDPLIGDVALDELRASEIQAALDSLELAPSTTRLMLSALGRAMRVAHSEGLVARIATDGVTPPDDDTRPEYLDPADLDRFIHAAMESDLWWSPLLVATATTGLRMGEVRGLRWSDVDLDRNKLHVQYQVKTNGALRWTKPKSKAGVRTIVLADITLALLQQHREDIERHRMRMRDPRTWQEHDLVFPSQRGRPGSCASINSTLKRVLERAGLPHMTLKGLRHTYATALLEADVPLSHASKILGHKHLRTTVDLYGHLSRGIARQATERFEGLLTNRPPRV